MGINLNNPNHTILGMLQALQQQHGAQPAQQAAPQAGPVLHQAPPQDEFVLADAPPPGEQHVVHAAVDMEVDGPAIEPEPVVAADAQDEQEPLPPLPAAPVVHAQPAPDNLVNNLPPLDLGPGVINLNNPAPQLPPLDFMLDQDEAE